MIIALIEGYQQSLYDDHASNLFDLAKLTILAKFDVIDDYGPESPSNHADKIKRQRKKERHNHKPYTTSNRFHIALTSASTSISIYQISLPTPKSPNPLSNLKPNPPQRRPINLLRPSAHDEKSLLVELLNRLPLVFAILEVDGQVRSNNAAPLRCVPRPVIVGCVVRERDAAGEDVAGVQGEEGKDSDGFGCLGG